MNKEKIAKLKSKIKDNALTIITVASLTTASAACLLAAKKFLDENSSWSEEFKLEEIKGETRDEMLKDDGFALLKLSDDEYMYVRQTAE